MGPPHANPQTNKALLRDYEPLLDVHLTFLRNGGSFWIMINPYNKKLGGAQANP